MNADSLVSISAALRTLPYAYHMAGDVERMVAALPINPAWVVEELMSDARVHEDCDNYIKADYIRAAARRVAALSGR